MASLKGFANECCKFGSKYSCVSSVSQSASASNFKDAYYDSTTKATVDSSTGPQSIRVAGGRAYRMDVTTYNSTITMTARRVSGG